jgi:hypothetical protein
MFFPLHILLMAIATLGIIIAVGAAIFFRKKSNWLKIHKSFNFFSLLGITAGIIMAVIYVSSTGGKHIDGLHQFIGSVAFVFAAVTLFLGFYQFKAKNKLALRSIHRLLGRFSLVLLLTAIMLGLKLIHII